jgi:hypothetical protein
MEIKLTFLKSAANFVPKTDHNIGCEEERHFFPAEIQPKLPIIVIIALTSDLKFYKMANRVKKVVRSSITNFLFQFSQKNLGQLRA